MKANILGHFAAVPYGEIVFNIPPRVQALGKTLYSAAHFKVLNFFT